MPFYLGFMTRVRGTEGVSVKIVIDPKRIKQKCVFVYEKKLFWLRVVDDRIIKMGEVVDIDPRKNIYELLSAIDESSITFNQFAILNKISSCREVTSFKSEEMSPELTVLWADEESSLPTYSRISGINWE